MMLYCNHNVKKLTYYENDTIILDKVNNRKKVVTGSLYMINRLITYKEE